MILPIGHDEGGVRRLPWVSFAVMAICFLAFILVKPANDSDNGKEQVWSALEYYLEHPYLELDPNLQDALGGAGPGARAMLEAARETIHPPEDAARIAEEQSRLDALTEECFDAIGVSAYHRWGLVPAKLTAHGFITHIFMHGGWLHLIGNLLIFYLAAPFIEDVWGRPLFAAFFIVGGLFAALAHIVRYPDSMVPMIGASGAVAAVMGAFLVRYWHTKIRFFYMFGLLIRGTFDAPAWVMLPLWFTTQIFFGMLTDSMGGGGVAHWAHVGGFGFGVAAAFGVKHYRLEERYLHGAIETKVEQTVVENAAVDAALEAHSRGESEAALRSLAEAVERHPSDEDAVLAYWSVAIDSGRPEIAAAAMVQLVEAELRAGKTEVALAHWSELNVRIAHPPVGADLLVRLAQLLARDHRHEEATMALRRALLLAGSGMTGQLALRIARTARALDPRIAQGAARLSLADPTLEPTDRAHAEKILSDLSGARIAKGA